MAHTLTARVQAAKKPLPAWRVLVAALGLALALSGTTGCMVMDELDTAAAKMPSTAAQNAQKQKDQKGPKTSTAERLAATKSMLAERSQKWWSEAKTMTPGESVAGIVSCRLPEGTQFMTKDDCLAQGGRAAEGGS